MRRDIQLLRGIAVLVVVLYHSKLGIIEFGYLGVDVFFVVSGFLITSIILKGLQTESFEFSTFYIRRAKRLLPALYCTLFFTSLVGLLVLTSQQWVDYIEQLKGALSFTANIVLPTQIGYFDGAADGKPLLHIWSLSLEEQYYFFLPLVLFIIPKFYRIHCLLLLFCLSLFWCMSWIISPSLDSPFSDWPLLWRIPDFNTAEWAFYLFPTRAWELLAGSICAWLMLTYPNIQVNRFIKVCSLVLVVGLCFFNFNQQHPNIESFLIVLATSVILLGKQNWLPNSRLLNMIEKLGDWSYSIYLVHWPLFAFAYLAYVGTVPGTIQVLLIATSLLLGYLQYRYIETPFREGRFQKIFSNWMIVLTTTCMMLVVPIALASQYYPDENPYESIRRFNTGLSDACEGSFDKNGKLKLECQSGEPVKIVVWGDSYAMHLVPGIMASYSGVAQLTKSACGPFLDLAPIQGKYDETWAKKCLTFNKDAINYIEQRKTLTHVVLSSPFSQYISFGTGQYLDSNGVQSSSYVSLLNSFQDTVSKIKSLGLVPVVVSPTPRSSFNVGDCLERKYGHALLLKEDCRINVDDYRQKQQKVINLLNDVEKITRVFWLSDLLCDSVWCNTEIDGVFIYRDAGHLSKSGSIKLLKNNFII